MKTLFEIVESAKDGNMPSHEECYWAMLALDGLRHFDHHDIMKLCDETDNPRVVEFKRKMYWSESFRRTKSAFAKPPKEWLGPNNDPSNPECQRMRTLAFNVLEKVTGIQKD